MSVFNLRLESVQRKTGGRIHLTPKVPRSGAVTTLCGQNLAAGSFAAVDREADCTNCLRRSRDPSRISGAFFAQEEGSQLLQLSLEQARARRPESKTPPSSSRPIVRVLPSPTPAVPDRIGELVTAGFKAAGEGLWRSPGGVLVRMLRQGRDWRFAELVFEGSIVATRQGGAIKLRAGDVEVRPATNGYEVRIKRP
ncbi:MAG TPA: hypothetical protein VLR46_11600 [Candidatus Dormibacteraeota bacterium]|nr:hypothetical protein [Candidatus Dormibacteraeota bacterium]